uniref:Amino acid permease/ SLC12A domain-containing protein n=1 Tax=Globisporangium ultimum (strain ATCC 200006 / CBS 805.95 / DAOM BR144) TaxID=431595 RepID=K3W863_GLOUD
MDELKVNLLAADDSSRSDAAHALPSPGRSARQAEQTQHGLPAWMYPPDGETKDVRISIESLDHIRSHMDAPVHTKLGEWPSTAICGNDILASVLYSSGIVAGKSGKLMPLTQVLVAFVLYLFRYIYEEAVTAIPLNGGSYNVLLNTTSKRTAAVAATLGIISYLATGVVSGTSALQYLNTQIELPVIESTVALLFAFAMLSIIGIAESSTVALVIFVLHVATLSLLGVCSGHYAITHPHVLMNNMKTDFPSVNVAGDVVHGNLLTAIFFGYSSAMLGITGFETSAQFVEEQKPGVFRKTLRNMWVFATFYNILLSCLSLAVLPLDGPDGIYQNQNIVLAHMGRVSSGPWLERVVSVDAFVVLSGGVLTSYVGITGLVRRLAFDRVLPAFLTKVNACRGTNHNIILIFFAVQASLVVLLQADASILAGVFTFAFLGVMALFAFGCMLLKLKREEIPRDVSAPWWSCIFGLVMVLLGLLGNLLGDPAILTYFALYFVVFAAIMFLMLERVFILRILLYVLQRLCPSRNRHHGKKHHLHTGARGGQTIVAALQVIHLPPIVFFCKAPELSVLNKAILYVRKNEQTHNLRIVHRRTLQDLHDMVGMFDLMYPKLKIDFVSVSVRGGAFDPSTVQWISQEMAVPTNMMFIRQPGTKHIHQVTSLGVRVITG